MLTHDELIAALHQGTADRGWISNCYAQIEFLLGDLINRCRAFPEYRTHTQTVSHSAAKRVAKVRSMLEVAGPLSPFRETIMPVLDTFGQNDELRNLLAHGFCEFHYTPDGDAGFVFKKFDRALAIQTGDAGAQLQRTLRLVDLEYHRTQMVQQAQEALEAFHAIHFALGWAGEDPTTMLEP